MIYAYPHTYTDGAGNEKVGVCTTYSAKHIPAGISAVEFPEGTPLSVVNGSIVPDYSGSISAAASKALSALKVNYSQLIGGGFSWNGQTVTLSHNDQVNNQMNYLVASYAAANKQIWSAEEAVISTTSTQVSGNYYFPITPGTTGVSEPAWSNGSGGIIADGTAAWAPLQFLVGISSGVSSLGVEEIISLGAAQALFLNESRSAYQASKAQITALASLPRWQPNAKYAKGSQIFSDATGYALTCTKSGASAAVHPDLGLSPAIGAVISDGATSWIVQGKLTDLIAGIS